MQCYKDAIKKESFYIRNKDTICGSSTKRRKDVVCRQIIWSEWIIPYNKKNVDLFLNNFLYVYCFKYFYIFITLRKVINYGLPQRNTWSLLWGIKRFGKWMGNEIAVFMHFAPIREIAPQVAEGYPRDWYRGKGFNKAIKLN